MELFESYFMHHIAPRYVGKDMINVMESRQKTAARTAHDLRHIYIYQTYDSNLKNQKPNDHNEYILKFERGSKIISSSSNQINASVSQKTNRIMPTSPMPTRLMHRVPFFSVFDSFIAPFHYYIICSRMYLANISSF